MRTNRAVKIRNLYTQNQFLSTIGNNERASYNGSIEASQASDVGSIPIARSRIQFFQAKSKTHPCMNQTRKDGQNFLVLLPLNIVNADSQKWLSHFRLRRALPQSSSVLENGSSESAL